MKRKIIALLLTLTMLVSMAPAVFAAGTDFIDVPKDAWYSEAVAWAVENDITGGIGSGMFGPDNTCTRAQVVTFLWAAAGKPEPASKYNPFTDVKESDWYYKSVLWAVHSGITNGKTANTFAPEEPCTRAQVVTFLYASAGKPEVKVAVSAFSDVVTGDWFLEEVQWAVQNNITGGIGGGKFGPNNSCTRAQIALFLYKADQINSKPEVPEEPVVKTKVLNVAFNQSISNPEAQTLQWISDELYRRTNGRYKLEIYPDAQLGDQAQTLEQVTMGVLDMAVASNSLLESYASDFAILGTPYVYDSEAHLNQVLQSDSLNNLFAATKQHGFTVLSGYAPGARNVYTRDHAVETPADLKGMKIRVMGSETCINMMNAMGGIGIAMAINDIYSSIQGGIIDGAENNINTYMDLVQYEVAPYYNKTNHLIIPDFLVIGNQVLADMSPQDAEILKAVCKESIQVGYDKAAALRAEYEAAAKQKGVVIVEADVPAFQALCAELIYSVANRSDLTRSAFDAIRSFSEIEIPEPEEPEFHIDIKFSGVFQPEEMNGKASEMLAEMITERTGGAVTVTYYGQNQLDCYGDSVAKAAAGENWMGLEEPSLFADYVGDCAVLIGPMLYASNAEYNYVMESDLVQKIFDRLASEHNIKILDTHYSFGFRSVCTNKIIETPEDLNGMVLRATSSPLYAKTLECLGATPQAMGFTEAIDAMANGFLDGYEGSISTHKDTGVYEFVHNVALTNHLIATRWLFMSNNVWEQIPAEYQAIILECAEECGVWEQNAVADAEAEMIAFLEENGTAFNGVDLDAFTAECGPVFDWIVEEYGADPTLRGKIVKLVQDYRKVNGVPTPPVGSDEDIVEYTLDVALGSEPDTLDPALNSSLDGFTIISHLFSGLAKYSQVDGKVVILPDAAEKLVQGVKNYDGTVTYTYTIRDMKWSDGEAVTAHDFEFAWKRGAAEYTGADYGYLFEAIKGYPNNLAVTALNDKTLQVTLWEDIPYWNELLAFGTYMPVREDVVANEAWATSPSTFVCNGMYTMTAWDHDDVMTLTKNEDHYNSDQVTVSQLNFQLTDDTVAMVQCFAAGSWQFIEDVPGDIRDYQKNYPNEFRIAGQMGTYYANWNVNKNLLPAYSGLIGEEAEKANAEIRQALSLILDRVYICDEIGQAGQLPASSLVSAGVTNPDGSEFYETAGHNRGYHGYYDVSAEAFEANFATALEVLKKYYPFDNATGKFKDVPALEYLYNTSAGHKAIGEYLQAAFANVGIDMQLVNLDWNPFLNRRKSGDYDVARNSWLADYNDPICFLDMWTSISGNNDVQFGRGAHAKLEMYDLDLTPYGINVKVKNGTWAETYDVLIAEIKECTNTETRYEMMHLAEDMLMETGCIIPLYYYSDIYMIDDAVKGFYVNGLGWKFFAYCTVE